MLKLKMKLNLNVPSIKCNSQFIFRENSLINMSFTYMTKEMFGKRQLHRTLDITVLFLVPFPCAINAASFVNSFSLNIVVHSR